MWPKNPELQAFSLFCCAAVIGCALGTPSSAQQTRPCEPEPEPAPLPKREACYSMVYYYLVDDAAQTRRNLETLRDLGATQVLTLVYWWQAETLGGDYWKKDYPPSHIGEAWWRSLDHFVRISRELGLRLQLLVWAARRSMGSGGLHAAGPRGVAGREVLCQRRGLRRSSRNA